MCVCVCQLASCLSGFTIEGDPPFLFLSVWWMTVVTSKAFKFQSEPLLNSSLTTQRRGISHVHLQSQEESVIGRSKLTNLDFDFCMLELSGLAIGTFSKSCYTRSSMMMRQREFLTP